MKLHRRSKTDVLEFVEAANISASVRRLLDSKGSGALVRALEHGVLAGFAVSKNGYLDQARRDAVRAALRVLEGL